MDDYSKNLASNLLAFRAKRTWSQMELAQYLGIPRATVANLESGVANPSLSNVLKISKSLQLSVEDLTSQGSAQVNRKQFKNIANQIERLSLGEEANFLRLSPGKTVSIDKKWKFCKLVVLRGKLIVDFSETNHQVTEGQILEISGFDKLRLRSLKRESIVLLSPV